MAAPSTDNIGNITVEMRCGWWFGGRTVVAFSWEGGGGAGRESSRAVDERTNSSAACVTVHEDVCQPSCAMPASIDDSRRKCPGPKAQHQSLKTVSASSPSGTGTTELFDIILALPFPTQAGQASFFLPNLFFRPPDIRSRLHSGRRLGLRDTYIHTLHTYLTCSQEVTC